MTEASRRRALPASPALSAVVGAAVALAGLAIGLRRLSDNSFFTHLATGRLILDGGIPRSDPYSFTAPGHPWVVQSWLAAAGYAGVDRALGGHGLVVLHGLQTAALAGLGWVLVRPAGTLVSRLLAVLPFVVVGSVLWSPRPLLAGLVLFALVVLVAEDERLSPWWLLPIGWLWVNVHGSFPFAVGYLAVRLAGRALDRGPLARPVRLLATGAAGTLAGALNPLGPRILVFPVHLLAQRAVLSQVVEWMSPDFSKPGNLVFLAEVVAALVLLLRKGTWEDGLVAAAFGFVGMTALRNTVVASLALTPVLARGARGIGEIVGDRRGGITWAGAAVLAALAVLVGAGAVSRPAYDLATYPVADLRWMKAQGLLGRRVLASDIVGNLRTLQEGPRHEVFIDDRYDMYPRRVALDYLELYYGRPRSLALLDRYDIDAVLWDRHQALAGILALDRRWTIVRRSRRWIVAVRAA